MTDAACGLERGNGLATSISLAALEQREAARASFRVPGTPAPKGESRKETEGVLSALYLATYYE
jgi:hypothetical protein